MAELSIIMTIENVDVEVQYYVDHTVGAEEPYVVVESIIHKGEDITEIVAQKLIEELESELTDRLSPSW